MLIFGAPVNFLLDLILLFSAWQDEENYTSILLSMLTVNIGGIYGYVHYRSDLFAYYRAKKDGFLQTEDEFECDEDDAVCGNE
jgi:hypothetical protein